MVGMPRSLDELVDADSAWPTLLDLFAQSPHDVEIVGADEATRKAGLLALQVTTHSLLGALVWNCGVVSIDHGWVRLLGAGLGAVEGAHPERLNDVKNDRVFEGVVAAYDVLGGRFAIHGGGLDEVPLGEVLYWAPDSLNWSATGMGHSAIVKFLLSERLADFYADLRWTGWESDVGPVPLDQGLSAYPFPWSVEGRGENVSRTPVPMAEVVGVAESSAAQLRGRPDGTFVKIELL
jgi:hypothetical protein